MEENKRTLEISSFPLNEIARKLGVNSKDITPMNRSEFASKYGVDVKIFNKWIKPFSLYIGIGISKEESKIFTVSQVIKIYEKLGPLPIKKAN